MPVEVIAPAAAGEPGEGFTDRHLLAKVVRRLHFGHGGLPPKRGRVGCDGCWEKAIRIDERFAVENGLGPLEADPAYLDSVAIERACKGRRGPLSKVERVAAVQRLTSSGATVTEVSRTLRMAGGKVHTILNANAADSPAAAQPGRRSRSRFGRSLALLHGRKVVAS